MLVLRWVWTQFLRFLHTVVGYMALALFVTVTVAVVAEAQNTGADGFVLHVEEYAKLLIVGLISGAIQYGAVKQRLDDHDRRITEARELAGKAHDKLFEIVRENGHR